MITTKLEHASIEHVHMKTTPGSTVYRAIRDAIKVSLELDVEVHLEHSSDTFTIVPTELVDFIGQR